MGDGASNKVSTVFIRIRSSNKKFPDLPMPCDIISFNHYTEP